MAQIAKNSAREVAMARRRASYAGGKAGLDKLGGAQDRTRGGSGSSNATASSTTSASSAAPRPRMTPMPSTSSPGKSSRDASRARREAMSQGGKAAIANNDRTRTDEIGTGSKAPVAPVATTTQAPAAGETERKCSCGCKGDKSKRPATELKTPVPSALPTTKVKSGVSQSTARAASLARRQAMSSKGKAAIKNGGPSEAQTARATNPNISSRDLAQQIREIRSKQGKTGAKCKTKPCGPTRRNKQQDTGGAQDAPWKVGAGETSHGQTVTGTMVGRSASVTGDEPSTCRAITGTEYLGADIFREFCQTDTPKSPRKVRVTSTATGNVVSGNELGRSAKVTGDEPGTCKRVTGSQYVSAQQEQAFCGTSIEAGPSKISSAQTRKGKTVTGSNVGRSSKVTGDESGAGRELTGTSVMQSGNGKAPVKVGASATLRGGSVTGTMVGRSQRVTGDEPGSCRNITGDDYIGQEQYSTFCKTSPKATDFKVGVSQTLKGKPVTGTMTGRDSKVTGDEPGTCKAVTGTPYAGAEQYEGYCATDSAAMARARTRPQRATPGSVMTGQQPGINGTLTGAQKGACKPLTGTPYVGADQFAQACPSVPAEANSPDFPQPLQGGAAPWTDFSVQSPSHASLTAAEHSAVTGTQYEKGHITGPFGMAGGKVTGTEEARFGNGKSYTPAVAVPPTTELVGGRAPSRITGEGQDTGLRITGDDWDRNERVTGTEGLSATRRNPTRRGGQAMAMQQIETKRNVEIAEPVSRVTGGSGNTEKGSLITYSGGARG